MRGEVTSHVLIGRKSHGGLCVGMMAGTALDLLQSPEKLAEAKAELLERVGAAGYTCPIPDGVLPKPVK
ncbi:MAG: hypothetical protein Q8S19_09955 [Bacillota bacterium]|nr:hypothetical protein [Bacillota bacterium]